ncbi:hypothetical protein PR048_005841 [Dryococelus australis]|uniref:Uncharacterized protein n=1 Tax=Dryococelus australis TaxID=614101 RepID=A0ABQ9I9A4_9NEOP|nr:hypothetical protein PR048_005841 [Dryococelus australis]
MLNPLHHCGAPSLFMLAQLLILSCVNSFSPTQCASVRLLEGSVTDMQEAAALIYGLDKVDVFSASWGPKDNGVKVDGPGKLAQAALHTGVTMTESPFTTMLTPDRSVHLGNGPARMTKWPEALAKEILATLDTMANVNFILGKSELPSEYGNLVPTSGTGIIYMVQEEAHLKTEATILLDLKLSD